MIQFKNHIQKEHADFEITENDHLEEAQYSNVDQISYEDTL